MRFFKFFEFLKKFFFDFIPENNQIAKFPKFWNLHVFRTKHRRKILKNLKNFSRIFRNLDVFNTKHSRIQFPMFFFSKSMEKMEKIQKKSLQKVGVFENFPKNFWIFFQNLRRKKKFFEKFLCNFLCITKFQKFSKFGNLHF